MKRASQTARGAIDLPVPPWFDLVALARSTAPFLLFPAEWHDGVRPFLRRVERLDDRSVHVVELRAREHGVVLSARGPRADEIERLAPLAVRARRSLGLDGRRRTRTLRGTTPFEDLLRVLLASGSGDEPIAVARRLCRLGSSTRLAPGLRAFPSPDQVARAGLGVLRDDLRLGPAAGRVWRFARAVATGRRDLASWDGARRAGADGRLARVFPESRALDRPARAWLDALLSRRVQPTERGRPAGPRTPS